MREAGPDATVVETAIPMMVRAAPSSDAKPEDSVWVALRPEKLRIAREAPPGPVENCAAGVVAGVGYLGDLSIYKVKLENGFVMKAALANVTRTIERPIGPQDRVWLSWAAEAGVVLTR